MPADLAEIMAVILPPGGAFRHAGITGILRLAFPCSLAWSSSSSQA